jgi:hypothetical protein
MNPKLTAIKKLCQHVLELSEKGTSGPWDVVYGANMATVRDSKDITLTHDDCRLISITRNVSPAMARYCEIVIDQLDNYTGSLWPTEVNSMAEVMLRLLISQFPDEILKPYME